MHNHKPLETVAMEAESDVDEIEEAITLGLGRSPQTELERLIVAARREFFAAEGRFLNQDELAREVAERRGGSIALDDE